MRSHSLAIAVALTVFPVGGFAADELGTNWDGSRYEVHLDPRESPQRTSAEVVSKCLAAQERSSLDVGEDSTTRVLRVDLIREYEIEKIDARLSGTEDDLVWVVQLESNFRMRRGPPGTQGIRGSTGWLVVDDRTGVVVRRGFEVDAAASESVSVSGPFVVPSAAAFPNRASD